jgi:tetratricopeptide (TPR) repeat protein
MVKSFGTDSTATHARESLPKRNGIEVTKNSTKSTQRAQPEGLAKVSDLGDEAFERMNYSEAIKLYKQSIRLLAQNSGDGDHLDLKQCKRYCVLTSMLLKLSRAYLHDEKKEESKRSLVSAEICVRKVTNNELNKENEIEEDIAMVKYSSLTLLSKVMEELGDAHERDADLTTAEQTFQEALSYKRECIKILREKDVVANVFKNRIQMNLEIGKCFI